MNESMYFLLNLPSGQFIINPEPECFGHFGARIPLLFTTFWGDRSRHERSLLPSSYQPLFFRGGEHLHTSIRWPMGNSQVVFHSVDVPQISNESPMNGPNSLGCLVL